MVQIMDEVKKVSGSKLTSYEEDFYHLVETSLVGESVLRTFLDIEVKNLTIKVITQLTNRVEKLSSMQIETVSLIGNEMHFSCSLSD